MKLLLATLLLAWKAGTPMVELRDLPAAAVPTEARMPRTELPVFPPDALKAKEVELVQRIPKALHPKVTLDWSGMVESLTLELPRALGNDEVQPAILAFLRAYPAAFGVQNPEALRVYDFAVGEGGSGGYVGEGEDYAGVIQVDLMRNREVRVLGHLWPISTEVVAVQKEALVKPFLGREVEFPSRRLGRNQESAILGLEHFELLAGPALVCAQGKARVLPAVYVRLQLAGNPLLEFPALFDACSHARVDLDYVLPTLNHGAPVSRSNVAEAFHGAGCFGPRRR
jgi:hypothetical protein